MISRYKIFFILILFYLNGLKASSVDETADSLRIDELLNVGQELFSEGMFIQALDSFMLSMKIGETAFGEEHPNLRNIHNALGITYRILGDFENSLYYFLKTEKSLLSDRNQNQTAIARIYNNIGNLYLNRLNYGMALDYYQRAADIYISQPEKNPEGIADFYYSMTNIYYNQNEYLKVIETAEKYLSYANPDTRLMFLSLIAASYKELNRNTEAYDSYKKTIEYAAEIYPETDLNVIFEYINFVHFLISVLDFEAAEEQLERIEELFSRRETDGGIHRALYFKARGLYYRNLIVKSKDLAEFRKQKTSNLVRAVEYYKKGLEALGTDTSRRDDASLSIGNSLSLTQSLDILSLIADTYVQISDVCSGHKPPEELTSIHQALDYYILTANMIHQARREMYSDENKVQLGELKEAVFYKIVQAAYRAYALNPRSEIVKLAFSNAERMKASAVFDRLSDQFAKENSLVPDSLTRLERNLNFSITRQSEKLFDMKRDGFSSSVEIAETDSVLFHLKKQRDELNQFLEKYYRDYYNLKYADVTILPDEVQKKLKNNEVLLEYVLYETDSVPEIYVFCFSNHLAEFHRLDIDASFIHTLEETFRFMADPDFLFTGFDQYRLYCDNAHQLYMQLIHPFTEIIQDKKIIIVPDGKLNYLPFDALLTELPEVSQNIQFNRLSYLIRKNPVHYSYSSNLLFSFPQNRRRAKNRLLAFAPEYKSDTVLFENDTIVLAPLPGILREVNLISKVTDAQLYVGKDATEKNFRRECSDHDILHLAMHAFINDSLPAFSRLAFVQHRDVAAEDDGWLNTADIYNFTLNARLAVLSACNTGTGSMKKGEGVMSLARGFLYAGCPSLVMTLWDVEDDAGTRIMHSFYRNLKKGKTIDEALRQAKLTYLENANARMAHPHYWLGYLSIGDNNSLVISYDIYFFLLLFFALTGIITDQLIRMKQKMKRR
jgi:CHAT domain-containing protein